MVLGNVLPMVTISVCNKQRPRPSVLCQWFRLIQNDDDDENISVDIVSTLMWKLY